MSPNSVSLNLIISLTSVLEVHVRYFFSIFWFKTKKKIYSEGWIRLQRDRMGRLEVPSQTKAVYILCLCELLHTWEILEEHKRLKKGEEPSSQRIKAFLCPLLLTWAPLNAICLNNDQNIIDTMRLPRAQSFNSAPLRMEKRKTEKERKICLDVSGAWLTGSDFYTLVFELESPDLSVLGNKEVGKQTGPPSFSDKWGNE